MTNTPAVNTNQTNQKEMVGMTNTVKAMVSNARKVNKHVVGFDVTAGSINLYFGYKRNSVETAVLRNGKVTDQSAIQLIKTLRARGVDTTILEKAIGHLKSVCQHCKKPLSTGVVSYCKRHAIGAVCYDCQKHENEVALTDNGGASEASANPIIEAQAEVVTHVSATAIEIPSELLAAIMNLELPNNTKRDVKFVISELQAVLNAQGEVIGESAPLSGETPSQPSEAPVSVTPLDETLEAIEKESLHSIQEAIDWLDAGHITENDRENEPPSYNNPPLEQHVSLGRCNDCGRSGVTLVAEGVCEQCE